MSKLQIWRCVGCRVERQWGCHRLATLWDATEAPDPAYKPLLECGCCQRATRHEFVEVRVA